MSKGLERSGLVLLPMSPEFSWEGWHLNSSPTTGQVVSRYLGFPCHHHSLGISAIPLALRRYCLKRGSWKEGGEDGTVLESSDKVPELILVDKSGSQRHSEREAASDGQSCEWNSSEYSPAHS